MQKFVLPVLALVGLLGSLALHGCSSNLDEVAGAVSDAVSDVKGGGKMGCKDQTLASLNCASSAATDGSTCDTAAMCTAACSCGTCAAGYHLVADADNSRGRPKKSSERDAGKVQAGKDMLGDLHKGQHEKQGDIENKMKEYAPEGTSSDDITAALTAFNNMSDDELDAIFASMTDEQLALYRTEVTNLGFGDLLEESADTDVFTMKHCELCPAGYSCDGKVSTVCADGTTSEAGASSCTSPGRRLLADSGFGGQDGLPGRVGP